MFSASEIADRTGHPGAPRRPDEPAFRTTEVLEWWRAMQRGEDVHPCARAVVEDTLRLIERGGPKPPSRRYSHDPEDGRGDDYSLSRQWPW